MNSNLLFDFTIDKQNKKIHVKREFAAGLAIVWPAWTTAELLDQWWSPKPFLMETKSLDFREGGVWLYAMISPENQKHWCRADYKKIDAMNHFSYVDAFCDETGKALEGFPHSHWNNRFSENNDTTTVDITLSYDSVEDLEKIIELGFREGFTMCMGNLDELLVTLKK